ncbi:MAG: hypothetical protein MZU84_03900 [Sphingobacterium sp.]|nr:hypothetical protein [Sphingobacterium sp.]
MRCARAGRTAGSRAAAWGALASARRRGGVLREGCGRVLPGGASRRGDRGRHLATRWRGRRSGRRVSRRHSTSTPGSCSASPCSAAVAAAVFVIPYWTEFTLLQLADVGHAQAQLHRGGAASIAPAGCPVVHDFFTRHVGAAAARGRRPLQHRWRGGRAATAVERLLGGVDPRRLRRAHRPRRRQRAALRLPRAAAHHARCGRAGRGIAGCWPTGDGRHWDSVTSSRPARLVLYAMCVLAGSAARLEVRTARISPGVRLGRRGGRADGGRALSPPWPRPARAMSRTPLVAAARRSSLLLVMMAGDVAAVHPSGRRAARPCNYRGDAMPSADWLPPGTLVHGKLANGLALESRIKPVFVGRGFGNYDDRLERDDIRYVLTYTRPVSRLRGPRDPGRAPRHALARRADLPCRGDDHGG